MKDKQNTFRDKTKIAIITKVDPQNKTVDIRYTNQSGEYKNLAIPYSHVGLTHGILFMPMKGDKVLIDDTQGNRPVIKEMYPTNKDYLPYLDPGEAVVMSENGSYIFTRNRRKKVKSTGELIDYDATKGPNGETDLEYEPGGVIIRARSKQQQDNNEPRWDNHSYIFVCDNGDISIQSMSKNKHKGMLFLDGGAGYVYLGSGDTKVGEYVELNPLTKELVTFTDGEEHKHVQTNFKQNIYGYEIKNVGNALQINVGVDVSALDGDFSNIKVDSDLQQGDIRIDNHTTQGSGKMYLHLKGDFDIIVEEGDVNVNVNTGKANITVKGDANVTSQGNVNLNADGGIYLNNNGSSDSVVCKSELNEAIQSHTHTNVQNGPGVSGTSSYTQSVDRKVYG